MKFLTESTLALATAFILFTGVSAIAQKPTSTPPPGSDGEEIKIESRLVVIPVSVTTPTGDPVIGLTKQDFRVLEEGRNQLIEQVGTAENVPLEIALLIDVSGSVNPLFEFEKNAAAQFLQSVMKPEDRATIFLIGDQPQSGQTRGDAAQTADKLRTVRLSGKFTAFYDTVLAAADFLKKNAPQTSRRVVVALTDGEDNWSAMTRSAELNAYRDLDVNKLTTASLNRMAGTSDAAHRKAQTVVLKSLQDADSVFYAVNPAGASFKLNKISLRAHTGMKTFADDTGGTAFTPSFQPVDTKDALQNARNIKRNERTLEQIFRQLANELRAQYLIQYLSDADFPQNRYVKLGVDLQTRGDRKVRARQGYYVKNLPKPPSS
ncbi:MAG: VWA domain-containing protein [Pyrinomonadaceae bacterium]